ncbi:hypothetical protein D3C78_1174530 [compost metagenome]
MIPSFSSSQPTLPLRLLKILSGAISASARALPNITPTFLQLSSVSCVAFTGASNSLNHFQTTPSFSAMASNTGASGANISPTGAKAALSPSTTPVKKALMGSQYLRISSAPATTAATTATTGKLIAPMAVTIAPPTVLNTTPSTPAAAMMALIPITTGHATRPIPPITPVSASAPPTTTPIVVASPLFFVIQPSSLSTYCVAVCVSLRSEPSCWSNRSVPTASYAD